MSANELFNTSSERVAASYMLHLPPGLDLSIKWAVIKHYYYDKELSLE